MIRRTGYFRKGSRRLQQGDWDDSVAELDGLARWIAAHGITRKKNDRLASYTEDIRQIADANRVGREAVTKLWSTCGAERLSNSIIETTEWIEIYSAFGAGGIDPQIRARLAKAVRGPVLYRDENPDASSNTPRDFQAELAIAAQLVSVGIEDVFFEPTGDSTFHFGGRLFYVETKRPASERKVGHHVGKAEKQLAVRYASSSLDPIGVVGLSVTKIINPTGGRAKVTSWSELDALLRAEGRGFVERHHHDWLKTDQRTLGVFVLLRFGAYVAEAGSGGPGFVPAMNLSFTHNRHLAPDRLALAHRLRDRLSGERMRLPGLP